MRFFVFIICIFLSSCFGYRLDNKKPKALINVKKINVPLFENKTLIPRLEAKATNSLSDAIINDGTYELGSTSKVDAIFQGVIQEVKYRQVRSSRFDTLRSEELQTEVIISWILNDAKTNRELMKGKANGMTRFFVDPNLRTARQNSLADALQRASTQIVARLADDF
jgi:Lipopolysaccharide-assembly